MYLLECVYSALYLQNLQKGFYRFCRSLWALRFCWPVWALLVLLVFVGCVGFVGFVGLGGSLIDFVGFIGCVVFAAVVQNSCVLSNKTEHPLFLLECLSLLEK